MRQAAHSVIQARMKMQPMATSKATPTAVSMYERRYPQPARQNSSGMTNCCNEPARPLIDSIDLGAAHTKNYEIAAHEGLRRMARRLGENDAVTLLDENLAQEKEALPRGREITTRLSNEIFARTAPG
jgi:hypothetical protein